MRTWCSAFLWRVIFRLTTVLVLLLVIFLPSPSTSVPVARASSFDFDDDYRGVSKPDYFNMQYSNNWYFYQFSGPVTQHGCLYHSKTLNNPNTHALVGAAALVMAGTPGNVISGTIDFPNATTAYLPYDPLHPFNDREVKPVYSFSFDYSSGGLVTAEAYDVNQNLLDRQQGEANLGTGYLTRLGLNSHASAIRRVIVRTQPPASAQCIVNNTFPSPFPNWFASTGFTITNRTLLIVDNPELETSPGVSGVIGRTYSHLEPFGFNTEPGSPDSSAIAVSGLSGKVTKVNVSLNSLRYSNFLNLHLVLGKQDLNKEVMLLSGVSAAGAVSVAFDDSGSIPISGLARGLNKSTPVYQPSNLDNYSGPVAGVYGPYGSTLANFNWDNPDGVWKLYFADNTLPLTQTQSIASYGWSLHISTVAEVTQNSDNGLGTITGTLSYALKRVGAGQKVALNTLDDNPVKLSGSNSLVVPSGVNLQGVCDKTGPFSLIEGSSTVSGTNGLVLSGNNRLDGLVVSNFKGRQILANSHGNHLDCTRTASNSTYDAAMAQGISGWLEPDADGYKAYMIPGQTTIYNLWNKNTGTTVWRAGSSPSAGYRLSSTENSFFGFASSVLSATQQVFPGGLHPWSVVLNVPSNQAPGYYFTSLKMRNSQDKWFGPTKNLYVKVDSPLENNLARGKPTQASSSVSGQPASNAADGSPNTFWSSAASDANPILTVDLQGTYNLDRFKFYWGLSHPSGFRIEVSRDNIAWYPFLYTDLTNIRPGLNEISNVFNYRYPAIRYVRLVIPAQTTSISLWEFEVFGTPASPASYYDFVENANDSFNVKWTTQSPTGNLTFDSSGNGNDTAAAGFAGWFFNPRLNDNQIYPKVLETHPPSATSYSTVQGCYNFGNRFEVVQPYDRLVGKIAFRYAFISSANAYFSVGFELGGYGFPTRIYERNLLYSFGPVSFDVPLYGYRGQRLYQVCLQVSDWAAVPSQDAAIWQSLQLVR